MMNDVSCDGLESSGRESNDSSGGSEGYRTPERVSPSSSVSLECSSDAGSGDTSLSEGPTLLDIPVNAVAVVSSPRRVFRRPKKNGRIRSAESLKSQLLEARRRICLLEESEEALKDYTVSIILEKERILEELAQLRLDYDRELATSREVRLQLSEAQLELQAVTNRLHESEGFALKMVDMRLDSPGFLSDISGHGGSMTNGSQRTSPDTVQEQSAVDTEGARKLDCYQAALNLVVKSRQHLRECQKAAKFWKLLAKADLTLAATMTPSSSELEDRIAILESATQFLGNHDAQSQDCETEPQSKLPADPGQGETVSSTMSHPPIVPPPKAYRSNIPRRSPNKTPARRGPVHVAASDHMPSLTAIARRLSNSHHSADDGKQSPMTSGPPSSLNVSARRKKPSSSLEPSPDSSPGSAIQALFSLERICAAFSHSNSVGSFEMTGDSSEGAERRSIQHNSISSLSSLSESTTMTVSSDHPHYQVAHRAQEHQVQYAQVPFPSSPNGDQTMSTPMSSPSSAGGKSVRWAVPISPRQRDSSLPSGSLCSTSGSDMDESSSSLCRQRSTSSSTPRRAAGTTIRRRAQPLRLPQAPLPPPDHPLPSAPSARKIKGRSNSTTNIGKGGRGPVVPLTIQTTRKTAPLVPRPRPPPRSPLRQTAPFDPLPSPFTEMEWDILSVVQPVSATEEKHLLPAIPRTPISNAHNIKMTSVQRAPEVEAEGSSYLDKGEAAVPYDYTKPVKPLKVVKRSSSMTRDRGFSDASNESSSLTCGGCEPLVPLKRQSLRPKRPNGEAVHRPALRPIRPPKLVQATLLNRRLQAPRAFKKDMDSLATTTAPPFAGDRDLPPPITNSNWHCGVEETNSNPSHPISKSPTPFIRTTSTTDDAAPRSTGDLQQQQQPLASSIPTARVTGREGGGAGGVGGVVIDPAAQTSSTRGRSLSQSRPLTKTTKRNNRSHIPFPSTSSYSCTPTLVQPQVPDEEGVQHQQHQQTHYRRRHPKHSLGGAGGGSRIGIPRPFGLELGNGRGGGAPLKKLRMYTATPRHVKFEMGRVPFRTLSCRALTTPRRTVGRARR
ncbi:hypothetical protein BKA70DRAFT_1261398 [Coprinopsis sp. MPI-PUGE-AT-0042]|nr:hypothetical protein BKA70DRAFT_1261398 [Coprinopsis sp. MPI-PUGE-AT-0042]